MVKMQLRLPDSIHSKIKKIALRESVSINQFLVSSISNELIRYETMRFFEEKARGFSEQDFIDALNEIPAVPPTEIDELSAQQLKIK
ncbi:MAG: toxin-antitoxin system HicB family antitoxin [candidate division KSB1 bacterium]|nr:toxin-antitoxin system HicB family antitoxin [candidate division KSB1 bacterium]